MNAVRTAPENAAERLVFAGRVQGVGFRPHLARLAEALGVSGWARNETGTVLSEIRGTEAARDAFAARAIGEAPPLSRPRLRSREPAEPFDGTGFRILPSTGGREAEISVPPDTAPCPDCLAELRDPADRRHGYPFINCTQCGPRYTIIGALPYDRPNTAMSGFPLCPACRREYETPRDRRFHAEPVACEACGPRLRYHRPGGGADTLGGDALERAISDLRKREIVALRAVGGYQLLCLASDPGCVQRLRDRKGRPDKPLAVMVREFGDDGLERVRDLASPDARDGAALLGPERPILLLPKRPGSPLAEGIAPGCAEVGIMLPSSPLHHLLLDRLDMPVVATSGNIGGEPILTAPSQAEEGLAHMADSFLHHDRPILRAADDPVLRPIGGKPVPLRMGRGTAPVELEQALALAEPVLATGAQAKTTIALGDGHRIILSPHIGEMASLATFERFLDLSDSLPRLYGITPRKLLCDAHPGYSTTRWAAADARPVEKILHHHAHASALVGEAGQRDGEWLVFTWDAVGYGEDGALWGGETFLGRPGRWKRVASLRRFRPIGGDRVAREPWRSAAALCWQQGIDLPGALDGIGIARHAWERGIGTHEASSIGRLFDAAGFLLANLHECSHEAQAPMAVEALAADTVGRAVELPLRQEGGLLLLDWAPLLSRLLETDIPAAARAADFHATLATGIAGIVQHLRGAFRFEHVGLTGGVFQNARLVREAQAALRAAGCDPVLHRRLPCNDASISFGQIIEHAARTEGEA